MLSVARLDWRWEDDADAYRSCEGVKPHYGADPSLPGVGFVADGLLAQPGMVSAVPPVTEGADADLFSDSLDGQQDGGTPAGCATGWTRTL